MAGGPSLGAGTWALGGPWEFAGAPAGWGEVDDEVSIAAVRVAYEGGVRLFDTADAYGCGHAERVLGKAVAPFRDDVVIATKAGLVFDEAPRTAARRQPGLFGGPARQPARLGTDHIDLYQLHPGGHRGPGAGRGGVFDQLAAEGRSALRDGQRGLDVIDVFAAAWMLRARLNVFGATRGAGALRGP